MKKLIVMIAALTAALFIVGCATSGPTAGELMSSAKNGAPDGTLVGQATAKAGSKDASLKKSQESALFQLVKGMVAISRDLVDDSVAAGRLSSSVKDGFLQDITTALTRSALNGAVKKDQGFGAGDVAWSVYYMEKSEVLREITNAVNAAKQNHAAGNFNLDGFDAKYSSIAAREWKN
jgi:hypothetical protein